MIVYGVDPSLTGTGVARADLSSSNPPLIALSTVSSVPVGKNVNDRAARLRAIASRVALPFVAGSVAVIEGPAYSRQHGARHERSGLFWLIVDAMRARDMRVYEVPPTVRARYATGHGHASKREIVAAVEGLYGVEPANDNEADALILAAIGVRLSGLPGIERAQHPFMAEIISDLKTKLDH